jgi:hypothetical protein
VVAQARKRRGPPVAKGGRIIGARRSSSRERRVFVEGCAVSFVLRRERDARRVCRWKALWVGEAHAFHEAPAEPILAASEQASGFEEKRNQAHGTEEATGVPEAVGARFHTAEENASA